MSTGLPTLAKTWQFGTSGGTSQVNVAQGALGSAILDNRTILFNIKNALLGFAAGACTMRYSCNSVTAGTAGDGVDRITAATNAVIAAGAHSWWVLQLTNGYQYCFDLSGGATAGTTITIVVSASAGFTGGTTTARPTATDEIIVINNTAWTNMSTDVAARWSVELSTDGLSCRIFCFSAGALQFFGFWDVPTDVVTGWSNPMIFGWIAGAATIASFVTSGGLHGRIGTTNAVMTLTAEVLLSTIAPSETTVGNIANEVDGNWPFWPCGCMSSTVGVRGRHGRLNDFWFGSFTIPGGDSYPATGTTGQFAQVGPVIVPWNGGAVNTS